MWGLAGIFAGLALAGAGAPASVMRGYSVVESARERADEARLRDIPTAADALDIATTIGARPHYAGTPADYALAVYMRDRMRAAGVEAELEAFTARVETPRELVLELAPPADLDPPPGHRHPRSAKSGFPVALDLAEVAEPGDPATAARSVGLPFNAGSADGDVSAPLVYAGRGRDADYATLAAANIDVRGAVLLVRYGAEFCGLLAARAQDRGAAGVVFYSDPQDDGDAQGLVDPAGPWRPATSIERSWVGPAIHIPTLPISGANAQILLSALRGISGPPGWSGALPVDYPVARGPGRVHLIVKLNRKRTTLWNTIGTVTGLNGQQSVIVGAQRDAWVYGVGADGAGIATVLETARALGMLVRGGWRPQRSIILAGWDGGAIGLAGSRAYIYAHRVALPRGCVAYLDADRPVTGPAFAASAVAALAPIIGDVTRQIPDPLQPSVTVYDRWAASPTGLRLPSVPGPAGGSDGESFLTLVGTPTVRLRFSGPFAVAGSSYDTLRYATRWSDPDFSVHRTAAQVYGTLAMRLADAPGAPYDLNAYPALIGAHVARLAAAATAAGLRLGAPGLRSALAALRINLARRQADGDSTLAAARTLDLLLYGVEGEAALPLPELSAAIGARDQARVDVAAAAALDALHRATGTIAR